MRHADHFAAVLAEAEPHLTTAGQLPWFALLTAERENILAALRYRCDVGDADGALQVAVTLAVFAMMLGENSDITVWMSEALAVEGGTNAELRLYARGMLALNSTAMEPAGDPFPDREDLATIAAGMDEVEAPSIPLLALLRPAVAFFAGDVERTNRYLDDALAGEGEWARATALMLRGNLAENSGDLVAMRADIEAALTGFRRIGERWGLASTLRSTAGLRTLDGDLEGAAAAYTEALGLMQEMRSHDDEVFAYGGLAEIAMRRDDPAEAWRYVTLARESAARRGSSMDSMFTLAVLGDLEYRLGRDADGRAHIAEALERLQEEDSPHPAQGHFRALVLGTATRIALGDGDIALATELIRPGFVAAVGTGDLPIVASIGVALVQIVAHEGRSADAALMLGAAARLRGAEDPTALDIRELTRTLRAELGDAEFDREYAKGRALTPEEAIARLDPA